MIGDFRKYYRSELVGSVGFKLTGKHCEGTIHGRPCRGGRLRDMCLDWEDALPDEDLKMANFFSKYFSSLLSLNFFQLYRINSSNVSKN